MIAAPTWPNTVERASPKRNVGLDYDTAWARTWPARLVRASLTDAVTLPLTRLITSPTIYGKEELDQLDGPVIFTANHSSHLDTSLVITSLPPSFRHHTVVAAATDYFFDRPWKAGLWALLLGTIPVERTRVNRKSAELAAELIEDGWSLLLYPEGGRTHDGWGQEFRGGAAYLAKRCNVPVVPVHLKGVRPIFARGSNKLTPSSVEVRFGRALRALPATFDGREEDARRFSERIEQAMSVLADESETDWWSARRRAASGSTPSFRGPDIVPWRRSWQLPTSSRTRPDKRRSSGSNPW